MNIFEFNSCFPTEFQYPETLNLVSDTLVRGFNANNIERYNLTNNSIKLYIIDPEHFEIIIEGHNLNKLFNLIMQRKGFTISTAPDPKFKDESNLHISKISVNIVEDKD